MTPKLYCLFVFVFISPFFTLYAQDLDIMSSFEDYSELDREIVYLHLNKSTYIKGESIGLQAYVLDKATRRLSSETTNLYCVIRNDKNEIVKKKLLMVNNGIAINDFTVDSLFTSGDYKISAFTNWMKNFKEKNFFSQSIRVIDPDVETEVKQTQNFEKIDAQFLPEGGHLITDVETTLGALIKDNNGFGVPNVECKVVNSNGQELTSFKVNQFGLGRFVLKPKPGEHYKVQFKLDETLYEFDIEPAKPKGVGLSVNALNDNTFITFKTNKATLQDFSNNIYTFTVHNGNQLLEFNFRFGNELEVVKAIRNEDLFSGINIVTLFDDSSTPILERQLFNYDGLKLVQSGAPIVQKQKDSLLISIPYNDLNLSEFNNFSVSVLPAPTRAYNHHENIVSSMVLQPYVRGYIENAQFYFQDISLRTKYELDNLLLTQGWSSYDWTSIFDDPPEVDFDFEKGIGFTANFTNNNFRQILLYPTLNNPFEIIELGANEMYFEKQGLFPISDEKIDIGAINHKGKPVKPYLNLKFSPSGIPEFNLDHNWDVLVPRDVRGSEMSNYQEFASGWEKVEQLDEVEIKAKREYTRTEKIRNASLGRVDFFDEKKKRRFRTFGNFLSSRGFVVLENKAGVSVVGSGKNEESYEFKIIGDPVIFIDDIILSDHNILRDYSLNEIDYIEINKSGIGYGLRGGRCVIKIKTNPFSVLENQPKKEVHVSFDIPLKFDVAKRFYIPKYASFKSNFYKEYGIVDWFSNVSTNQIGTLNLKVFNNNETDIKLFIEGFSNDGTFISEVKEINSN